MKLRDGEAVINMLMFLADDALDFAVNKLKGFRFLCNLEVILALLVLLRNYLVGTLENEGSRQPNF